MINTAWFSHCYLNNRLWLLDNSALINSIVFECDAFALNQKLSELRLSESYEVQPSVELWVCALSIAIELGFDSKRNTLRGNTIRSVDGGRTQLTWLSRANNKSGPRALKSPHSVTNRAAIAPRPRWMAARSRGSTRPLHFWKHSLVISTTRETAAASSKRFAPLGLN